MNIEDVAPSNVILNVPFNGLDRFNAALYRAIGSTGLNDSETADDRKTIIIRGMPISSNRANHIGNLIARFIESCISDVHGVAARIHQIHVDTTSSRNGESMDLAISFIVRTHSRERGNRLLMRRVDSPLSSRGPVYSAPLRISAAGLARSADVMKHPYIVRSMLAVLRSSHSYGAKEHLIDTLLHSRIARVDPNGFSQHATALAEIVPRRAIPTR